MSAVPGNSPHDLNKQVAAAQASMYQNTGGIPTQHHQSMGGPVPNAQPATLVQQGQQMRANPMAIPNYYQRGSLPRTMANIGRNTLQTVVNQTGQQPTSQYPLQIMPAPFSHPMQPTALVNQLQQFPVIKSVKVKNAIPIIDPYTGKNILDGINDDDSSHSASEKETDNFDENICAQFATQIAATQHEKSKQLSKSSSIEDTRDMQTVMRSGKIDVRHSESNDGEFGDVESLADVESSSDDENIETNRNTECTEKHLPSFIKEIDSFSINETVSENKINNSLVLETPVETRDSDLYNSFKDETYLEIIEDLPQTSDADAPPESTKYHEVPEPEDEYIPPTESSQQKAVFENQLLSPSTSSLEENKNLEILMDVNEVTTGSYSKIPLDGIKGKAKKKKGQDYNKKRESKEGGEMDDSLDKREMDDYFSETQEIVNKSLISSRVRIMLQEVIDLRKNNWVPKKEKNNSNSID